MLKNEEQDILIKVKFQTIEGYLNELEKMFMANEVITPETSNKIALIVGKLSIQIHDLETYLEIYGSVEENYKDVEYKQRRVGTKV